MDRSAKTREALLGEARKLFWNQGYGNVSLRDITRAAGVDVALVSRYFGGKLGLFEATLDGAFYWPELLEEGADLMQVMVDKSTKGLHEAEEASPMKMLIMNSADPEVGPLVRASVKAQFTDPLAKALGGEKAEERMAMVMAALIGSSIVRFDIQAAGLAESDEEKYGAQLRHLVMAALDYPGAAQ